MKIGILLAGHLNDAMIGDYGDIDQIIGQMLQGNGFDIQCYAVCDNQFPSAVSDADGWLVSGSINSANDDIDWINQLKVFIRDIYQQEKPLVGICFGHQVIASALGGKVEKSRYGWTIGNQAYHITAPVTDTADAPLRHTHKPRIIAWHQDQVIEKPKEAQCIGTASSCDLPFLLYGRNGTDNEGKEKGKYKAFTLQPHPEFNSDFGRDLLTVMQHNHDENTQEKTRESFNQSLDSPLLHRAIAEFFKSQRLVLE